MKGLLSAVVLGVMGYVLWMQFKQKKISSAAMLATPFTSIKNTAAANAYYNGLSKVEQTAQIKNLVRNAASLAWGPGVI
jgi:predicted negative regulator of RcsB-dependent stress response